MSDLREIDRGIDLIEGHLWKAFAYNPETHDDDGPTSSWLIAADVKRIADSLERIELLLTNKQNAEN